MAARVFMMIRWIRRRRWVWIPLVILGIVLIVVGRLTIHLIYMVLSDWDRAVRCRRGWRTMPAGSMPPVAEIWKMPSGDQAEEQLRELLTQCSRHLRVSIAGAATAWAGRRLFRPAFKSTCRFTT